MFPSLLVVVLIHSHIESSSGQSCTTSNYDTGTSDSVPSQGVIPSMKSISGYGMQEIDLTNDYYYFDAGYGTSNSYPSWKPGYNSETNTITITNGKYGSGNNEAFRAWNGTIFPNNETSPFFTIYPSFDHSKNIFHRIRFELKQDSSNQVNWGGNCVIAPKLAIFSKNKVNFERYPNNLGCKWIDGEFCERTNGIESGCIEIELSDNSLLNGIKMNENSFGDSVWIQFDENEAIEWTQYEVIFRLKQNYSCNDCFAAITVENNGWPKWNTNISWAMRQLTIERLSANVKSFFFCFSCFFFGIFFVIFWFMQSLSLRKCEEFFCLTLSFDYSSFDLGLFGRKSCILIHLIGFWMFGVCFEIVFVCQTNF